MHVPMNVKLIIFTCSECSSVALVSMIRACVVLHCHLWSVRLYHIFAYYKLIDFRKKFVRHNVCFDFLHKYIFFYIYIPRRIRQHIIVSVHMTFEVQWSMHLNIFLQYNQKYAPVSQIIYPCKTLHMFRKIFPSIISS